MIYDKLSNAKRYLGISSNLDAALRFIAEHDLNQLPLGKTVILDDQVFIYISMTNSCPPEERHFKIHKKYMDIQIDIFGTEQIAIGDSSNIELLEYDAQKDIGLVHSATLAECIMSSGHFAICMADEPHKTKIISSDHTSLKKCVLKVHI